MSALVASETGTLPILGKTWISNLRCQFLGTTGLRHPVRFCSMTRFAASAKLGMAAESRLWGWRTYSFLQVHQCEDAAAATHGRLVELAGEGRSPAAGLLRLVGRRTLTLTGWLVPDSDPSKVGFRADRGVHMGQWGACARKRPFDVHGHNSLTCGPRVGYGSLRRSAVLIGEF